MDRRTANGWRAAPTIEPPERLPPPVSDRPAQRPRRTTANRPTRHPWGALPDLARAWPRGEGREALVVIATVAVALAHLVSWVATALARGVFGLALLGARGVGWVANKINGGQLAPGRQLAIGWLAVIIVLSFLSADAYQNRAWLQAHLHLPTIGHARSVVPYVPPPASCVLPRAVCAPPTEVLDGQPSISAAKILSVLQANASPAASEAFAAALYDDGVQYGVNPAYALAFFAYESHYGTQGRAAATHSLGNIRFSASNSPVTYTDNQGFRQYASWQDGAQDWFWLIRTVYLNQGVRDIYDVTPIYAPSSDGNDPGQYAQTVYQLVQSWSV